MTRFDSIQSLRAIAAALVVFTHALMNYNAKVSEFHYLYDFGSDFGVKLFFCISGFIIFKTTINLQPNLHSSIEFAIKRIIRIVPIYWIATLIYAFKQSMTGIPITFNELLNSLFFIPYVNNTGLTHPILGVGWTLNYEMFFYFILTLVIFIPFKFRTITITAVMVTFLFYFNQLSPTPHQKIGDSGHSLLSTYYLLYFLFGVFIGQLTNTQKFESLNIQINDRKMIPILIILIFMFLIVTNLVKFSSHESKIIFELAICSLLIFLSAIAPVKQTQNETDQKQSTSKIRKIIVLAGDGSYSTYLFHGFLLGVSARLISMIEINITPYFFAFLMVVFCTTIGILIHKTIEKPIIKYLNKKWHAGYKLLKTENSL